MIVDKRNDDNRNDVKREDRKRTDDREKMTVNDDKKMMTEK